MIGTPKPEKESPEYIIDVSASRQVIAIKCSAGPFSAEHWHNSAKCRIPPQKKTNVFFPLPKFKTQMPKRPTEFPDDPAILIEWGHRKMKGLRC
jgi:hypothetical protein